MELKSLLHQKADNADALSQIVEAATELTVFLDSKATECENTSSEQQPGAIATIQMIDECSQIEPSDVKNSEEARVTSPISQLNQKPVRSSMKSCRDLHNSSQKKRVQQAKESTTVDESNTACSNGIAAGCSNGFSGKHHRHHHSSKHRSSKRQRRNSEIQMTNMTNWKRSQNYSRAGTVQPGHSQFSTRILKPNDYLFFSIFTTIFCFFPLGKFALVVQKKYALFKTNVSVWRIFDNYLFSPF
jgi:hypothetical protein